MDARQSVAAISMPINPAFRQATAVVPELIMQLADPECIEQRQSAYMMDSSGVQTSSKLCKTILYSMHYWELRISIQSS